VIDVRHFGHRESYSDIEELQLQTASHSYFSHHSENEIPSQITNRINTINPHASILDKDSLAEAITALGKRKRSVTVSKPNSTKVFESHLVTKSKQHLKTHEFTACQLPMPRQAREDTIKTWLSMLPSDVIRVKLLIGISESPKDRYLFERVGNKISKYPQRVILNENVPNSAILIGPNLDTQKLKESAEKYFPH
jgi:G3E family GTPase